MCIQVFPRRQLSWQGIQKNAKVMEHYHGPHTSGLSTVRTRTWSKGWSSIRFLVSSPVKERKIWSLLEALDQRWRVSSKIKRFMTDFCPRRTFIHQSSTRSLRQESGYIDVFFQEKDWEGPRTIFVPYWILKEWRFNKTRRPCASRFWNEQRRESSVRLTSVATGSESRAEVQAVPPREETSWFNVSDPE